MAKELIGTSHKLRKVNWQTKLVGVVYQMPMIVDSAIPNNRVPRNKHVGYYNYIGLLI